jgi:hypothetical protein
VGSVKFCEAVHAGCFYSTIGPSTMAESHTFCGWARVLLKRRGSVSGGGYTPRVAVRNENGSGIQQAALAEMRMCATGWRDTYVVIAASCSRARPGGGDAVSFHARHRPSLAWPGCRDRAALPSSGSGRASRPIGICRISRFGPCCSVRSEVLLRGVRGSRRSFGPNCVQPACSFSACGERRREYLYDDHIDIVSQRTRELSSTDNRILQSVVRACF